MQKLPKGYVLFIGNSNQLFFWYRIIGAVLIIIGLYLVLWGKNEEQKFAKLEAAAIQAPPADHGSNISSRATTHIKSSLAQPLLSQ